jgi:hypothetical protein
MGNAAAGSQHPHPSRRRANTITAVTMLAEAGVEVPPIIN